MQMPFKRKTKFEIIMYASAAWFILVAVLFLTVPAFGQFFEMGPDASRVVAGALFLIAMLYTLIVPFLFKVFER